MKRYSNVKLKFIALILVVLTVASVFSACAFSMEEEKKDNDKTDNDKTGSDTVADTGAETSSEDTTTVVPDVDVLNWDGREYRILGRDHTMYDIFTSFEVWREDVPEDVVGKAVWDRNYDMLQNYGIDVKGYLKTDFNSAAKTMLDSGEDLYDLLILAPESFHPHAINGALVDLYGLDYINMAHDAWMDYPNRQLTMGGRLYYTTNKFLIQDKNRYWGLFYNRSMAKELNLGYFENMVFDGSWTMDKVIELAKAGTFELDGQQGLGKRDNWGVCAYEYYNFVQLAFGVGFRFTEHGPDGYPVLIGPTDDIISRLDKMYQLSTDSTALWSDERTGDMNTEDSSVHMFYGGRALMLIGSLSELQQIGGLADFEYGVLPNPKYNEDQEIYHTIPNLMNGSLFGVPATISDKKFAGYALELISEKAVDTSYKAFIEVNCKLQKAQDEDAAKCLQIIYEGVVYDIAFVSDIGGLGSMLWRQVAGSTTNNYSRLFKRSERIVNAEIEKVRAAYAALK